MDERGEMMEQGYRAVPRILLGPHTPEAEAAVLEALNERAAYDSDAYRELDRAVGAALRASSRSWAQALGLWAMRNGQTCTRWWRRILQ